MTDDLLTSFRSDVPLPDDASAKRAYERAVNGRRRLPRRRLAYALAAVVVAGGLAGGLSATLGGASELGVGAHVGIGATVIQGLRIGAGAFVAAGAVVVADVPDGVAVAGVPAKPRRSD